MKIAALQMVSTPNVDQNCAAAQRLIAQAARDGAELVALPEYFCLMGRSERDKLAIAEAPGDGPIQRLLAQALLKKPLTQAGTREFRVSGPWADPKVDKVDRKWSDDVPSFDVPASAPVKN